MFIVITLSWNAITCFLGVELSMRSFFVISVPRRKQFIWLGNVTTSSNWRIYMG